MVNWKLVTRPKSLGGLGIRDILITNKALMAKWMWQWHIASTSWWKEATPVIDESHKPWNDTHGSIFWKAIAEITPPFECSTRFTIGNGQTVRFWEDNWLGTPLKLLFPLLYQMRNHRQQPSVNRYSEILQWLLQLPMQSLDVQLQRDELLPHLLHLQTTQTPDEITWIRGENSFTVNSFYKFLAHTPSPTSPLKNLWTIKAPLRVMTFAWLMLNNRLTTIDNLTRRGWYLTNMCVMCRQNEESTAHLFQHCPFIKQVKSYILSTFPAHFAVPNKFAHIDSVQMLTDAKESTHGRNLEIATCFVIWRERCRRIFSDKISHPLSLVREIRGEFGAWFTH